MSTTPQGLRGLIEGAGHILVFTGAGVSAESGIATFRDALTGLWANLICGLQKKMAKRHAGARYQVQGDMRLKQGQVAFFCWGAQSICGRGIDRLKSIL